MTSLCKIFNARASEPVDGVCLTLQTDIIYEVLYTLHLQFVRSSGAHHAESEKPFILSTFGSSGFSSRESLPPYFFDAFLISQLKDS